MQLRKHQHIQLGKQQRMQLIRQPKSCATVAQVTDHVWMAEFGDSTFCGKAPSMFPAGK